MKLSSNTNSKYLVLLCCGLFLFQNHLFSQNGDLYVKAKSLLNSNPDEAIKIAEHLLKLTETQEHRIGPNTLLAQGYFNKGLYKQAVSHAFHTDNSLNSNNATIRVELDLLKSKILNELALYKQAKTYVEDAKQTLIKVSNSEDKNRLTSLTTLQEAAVFLSQRDNLNAQKQLNNPTLTKSLLYTNNPEIQMDYYLYKTSVFSNLAQLDSAEVYIKKAHLLTQNLNYNNIYQEAQLYTLQEELLLKTHQFANSETNLFIALRYASLINNPSLLLKVYKDLSTVNLALNKKSQYKVYNDEFLLLKNELELAEQEAINTLFNRLQEQEELNQELTQTDYAWQKNLLTSLCATLILLCSFIVYKSTSKKKRLKEIIKYLEINKTNFLKLKPVPVIQTKTKAKSKNKNLVISEETEQTLLNKLSRFENSTKFLNKDMSLSVLAGKFETNTRYLSEVINKHYNDNFNTFINKLRIDYIIKKLKDDPNYVNYKISYLAEECGFSSHSNFTTVFKSIVGMSPATFINLIKTDQENKLKSGLKKAEDSNKNKDVA